MTRILVPLDGSEHAWKAFGYAVDIAKSRGGELLCLHVVPAEPRTPSLHALARAEGLSLDEEMARRREGLELGDALTREAEQRARAQGLERVRGLAAAGKSAVEIVAVARDEEVDAIVLGVPGTGLFGGLLGAVSRKVARTAPCTCVMVR